jgi:hypothetical protein
MQIYMTLFIAALFYALTPGILITLPPKGSKMVVALTHAVVFAVVYGLVHKAVSLMLYPEGFAESSDPAFQACIASGGIWSPQDDISSPPIPAKCIQTEGFNDMLVMASKCAKTAGAAWRKEIPAQPVMTPAVPGYCELSAASCAAARGTWNPRTSTCINVPSAPLLK